MMTRFAGLSTSSVGREERSRCLGPTVSCCGGHPHGPRAPASLGPDPSSSRDGEQSSTAPSSLPPQSSPSRLPSQAGARRRSRPLAQARPALLDFDPRGRGAIRHVSRPSGSHTRVRETRRSPEPDRPTTFLDRGRDGTRGRTDGCGSVEVLVHRLEDQSSRLPVRDSIGIDDQVI
jgi:hypothetical protein